MLKSVLFIGYFSLTQLVYAQEYFTSDFSFYQIETNPASITSPKLENVIRSNFKVANHYSSQNISGSTMLSNSFIGLGASLSNTNVNGNKHQKAGITVGYRNVLFSHVKIRGGIHYKLLNNTSTKGIYNLYSFVKHNDKIETNVLHNANYSISFTDMGDRFYVSAGKLNSTLLNTSQGLFKKYRFISAGYLFSPWNSARRLQFSYSLIQTKSILGTPLNHNLSLAHQVNITRRLTLIASSQVGYWNNSIYRLKPALSFYTSANKNKSIVLLKLGADIGINKFNQSLEYPPTLETTIQLKL
jgi:hypothetical protein